ncbi:hypothetical protein RCL1_002880 [Eukaryota sp. TZLM3-RCL]
MIIPEEYRSSLSWVGLLLVLVVVQWMIATVAKAKQPGAIPGLPPSDQSHANFAFRAFRTHQNTLENLGIMLGGAFLAILAGANAFLLSWLLGIMVVCRVIHMILYYVIATEVNPSPRSYFFIIGWLANVVLIVVAIFALFK